MTMTLGLGTVKACLYKMTMIGMMRIVPTLNYATNVFLMHNFFLG